MPHTPAETAAMCISKCRKKALLGDPRGLRRTSALAVLIPGVGELTYCRFNDQKNKTSTKQGLVISFGNCKNPETRSLCIVLLRLYILWYDLATNPFETKGDFEV